MRRGLLANFRGARPKVEFAALIDVLYAKIDLASVANPTPVIMAAPEFAETTRFFAEGPSRDRSLLPAQAQALLYTVIRNQQPQNVVEIGTYKGGTAEALARALHANGHGMLHTVSPFDVERFGNNYRFWPPELKRVTQYHPVNSMDFFIKVEAQKLWLDLVLVDGNHDYEFAMFDILSAAQWLKPGGFIFVDNVSQVGPFLAATDFYAANPHWLDCGVRPLSITCERAFDRNRQNVPYTDFFIFRSPQFYSVGRKPKNFGNLDWTNAPVNGIRFKLTGPQPAGTLHVQCILRAFSEARIDELTGEAVQTIDGDSTEIEVKLDRPVSAEGDFFLYRVEPWLIWLGDSPLKLETPPVPF